MTGDWAVRVCVLWAVTVLLSAFGSEQVTSAASCVRGPGGELTVGTEGLALCPSFSASPAVCGKRSGTLWTVLLQRDEGFPSVRDTEPSPEELRRQREPTARQFIADNAVALTDRDQTVVRETLPDGIRLRYDVLRDGHRTWQVSLTLEIRRKGRVLR